MCNQSVPFPVFARSVATKLGIDALTDKEVALLKQAVESLTSTSIDKLDSAIVFRLHHRLPGDGVTRSTKRRQMFARMRSDGGRASTVFLKIPSMVTHESLEKIDVDIRIEDVQHLFCWMTVAIGVPID